MASQIHTTFIVSMKTRFRGRLQQRRIKGLYRVPSARIIMTLTEDMGNLALLRTSQASP